MVFIQRGRRGGEGEGFFKGEGKRRVLLGRRVFLGDEGGLGDLEGGVKVELIILWRIW